MKRFITLAFLLLFLGNTGRESATGPDETPPPDPPADEVVCPPEDSLAAGADPAARISGYRGIWFSLGQVSQYGDKYSGGLGTYTAKHHPLAIYAPEVDRTFFVYGGTTAAEERHLLAMASYYDHACDVVPQPVVVHDKEDVNDPHDNPSLAIDGDGHLWVFVSGRAQARPGFIYRSVEPHNIGAFERIDQSEFTYPQPWWVPGRGFMLLFTRYTDGRELYWSTSPDGESWSPAAKLAEGGHYQMSNHRNGRIITAFNAHPNEWGVDARTNLYFLQTDDMGQTWRTADGTAVSTPVSSFGEEALVRDYRREFLRVYLKDIQFDLDGNPILLYLTSKHHQPGPRGEPRTWTVAHWNGTEWLFHDVTTSTHNYDMGSLYVASDGTWRILAPTEPGPQEWGTGGEVALWTSTDQGVTWTLERQVTTGSTYNHTYVRRPVDAQDGFYAFWADGNPDALSRSHLYFTNRTGSQAWRLPYTMTDAFATPEPVP